MPSKASQKKRLTQNLQIAQTAKPKTLEKNYTSIDPKQHFSHSHKLDYFDSNHVPAKNIEGKTKYDTPPQHNKNGSLHQEFRREPRETSIQISELERVTKQDPIERRQRETNQGMMKLDPVAEREGRQTWKHDETGSSGRETKGDKPGNHDEKKIQ